MGAQALLQLHDGNSDGTSNLTKQAVRIVFDYEVSTPVVVPACSHSKPDTPQNLSNTTRVPETPHTADNKGAAAQDPTPMQIHGFSSPLKLNAVEDASLADDEASSTSSSPVHPPDGEPPLVWDWDIEHADRKKEREADAKMRDAAPFEVDRRLLKDVVREKMGREVGRIKFLSAGTFHKAYLVTLADHEELVARVARRFMPRLKIESEVATLSYLREKTTIPVPRIYHYDSNPYNRLGGEWILMSKAPGIPLSQVYHGLAYKDLVKLVKNLASITIQLFAHRFTDIGSLYFGPDPRTQALASGTPTPKVALQHYSGFPFTPTLNRSPSVQSVHTVQHDYHVGPIISWPFFGSNRGELVHPTELNRGPWSTTESYLESCVQREINGVQRENAGSAAPHRLHLDPDEIHSSRHHKLRAVPGDESDDSDEYDLEESEEEWEGPGSAMYRDYRRNQRSTFLVAHLAQREEAVKREMNRWKHLMERLVQQVAKEGAKEEFGLDAHDLSLENVFVDANDHSRITCIIDWESTTTRPLWATAHVPACLQSSPFVSKMFRAAIAELPSDPNFTIPLPPSHPHHHLQYLRNRPSAASTPCSSIDIAHLSREWLYHEATGARLRMAHRCAEWDGWEEGLVESILGPEEMEAEWFKFGSSSYDHESLKAMISGSPKREDGEDEDEAQDKPREVPVPVVVKPTVAATGTAVNKVGKISSTNMPFIVEEKHKEKMMAVTGDICGGRGGELGRRLEAWLTVTGGNASVGESVEVDDGGAH